MPGVESPSSGGKEQPALWTLENHHHHFAKSGSSVTSGPIIFHNAGDTISTDYKCGVSVAVGSDLPGTQSLFALLFSIIQHYLDDRNLCIFVFSTPDDLALREASLDCAFSDMPMPNHVRIISKAIRKDKWYPRIFSEDAIRKELDSDYNWFRFYLTPEDVGGLSRIIYWDTDTLCRGNIAVLYDWDLNGSVAAGVAYDQPLKAHLYPEHKHELNKIPMTNDMVSPLDVNQHLNCGIMVMDLDELSNQHVLEKYSQLLTIHEKKRLWKIPSQTAFELAIHGMYEALPSEWNLGFLGSPGYVKSTYGTGGFELLAGRCRSAKGLHWNGPDKPWHVPYQKNRHKKSKNVGSLCPEYWYMYDVVSLHNKAECLPVRRKLK